MLDAIRWITRAWDLVKQHPIRHCFLRAGFPITEGEELPEVGQNPLQDAEYQTIVDNIPWIDSAPIMNDYVTFESQIPLHQGAHARVEGAFREVLREFVFQQQSSAESSDEEKETTSSVSAILSPPIPTFPTALENVKSLLLYANTQHPDIVNNLLQLRTQIEQHHAKDLLTKFKESSILAYLISSDSTG